MTVRTVNLQVHPSGKIIELSNGGCPYKSHLYDLEEEQGIEGDILYALFPDTNGKEKKPKLPSFRLCMGEK